MAETKAEGNVVRHLATHRFMRKAGKMGGGMWRKVYEITVYDEPGDRLVVLKYVDPAPGAFIPDPGQRVKVTGSVKRTKKAVYVTFEDVDLVHLAPRFECEAT